MSEFTPDQERDLLAAEHALRLLEADELARAQALALADPLFGEQVEAWQARLAPFAAELQGEHPDPALWTRIEQAISASPLGGNVIALQRRVKLWRAYGTGATAIAASLALVVGYQASRDAAAPEPVQQAQPAPMLVASLASDEADTALAVTYHEATSSLLVTPTRLQGMEGRDHELWIIPEGGKPISLGLVRGGSPSRHTISSEIAPHFRQRSSIALSVEPYGGSPTGQPTGPVIAAGELGII